MAALGKGTEKTSPNRAGLGKGGPRHSQTPRPDVGLLSEAMAPHTALLKDLGAYETLSATHGADYHAMVKLIDLWRALGKVEPSHEIAPQSLRTALLSLLARAPDLNSGGYTGQVWASLKSERLGCLLNHVRRLKREPQGMSTAAALLTRSEFVQLQAGLSLVELKAPLEKEKPSASTSPALGKGRDLKQSDSDVSLNSLGLPKMFDSPKKEAASSSCKALVKAEPESSSCRALVKAEPEQPEEGLEKPFASVARARRPGSRVPQKEERLMELMGHSPTPKALAKKRPAAALGKAAAKAPKAAAKAKPAAKAPLKKGTGEDPGRKPWVKLRKTIAQNPKRAYLQGTTDGLEKLRLVVEVPERRTPDFEEIIDEIKAALEKDHLTKAEAIAMRERLYAEKGC